MAGSSVARAVVNISCVQKMQCVASEHRSDAQVSGLNMEQVNSWQWRPDYEGMDLANCRYGYRLLLGLSQFCVMATDPVCDESCRT